MQLLNYCFVYECKFTRKKVNNIQSVTINTDDNGSIFTKSNTWYNIVWFQKNNNESKTGKNKRSFCKM